MIKKLFTSAALALLLMVSVLPRAHAEAYISLGSYSAGAPLSLYVCQVEPDVVVLADNLPDGCQIRDYESAAGRFVNLEGVPTAAGSFTFTIDAGERFYCTIDISAAVPWARITGDTQCRPGDRVVLECEAGSPDGGTLSYQWYSGMGVVALPIEGATDSRYEPDTTQVGTEFYSCLVTNTNGPFHSEAQSESMTLSVVQPSVSAVSI